MREIEMKALALTGMALAVIAAVILAGGDCFDGPVVYTTGGKAVYFVKSRAETVSIYESTADFITNGDAKLSPTNDYIAVIETEQGVVPPEGHDYSILPGNNLVIIDTSGNIIYSTGDNARRCSWSPDGKRLAYITGLFREEGIGFRPTGVYILDIPGCTKTKIVKDYSHTSEDGYDGGGYDLNWAMHDSMLYIQESPHWGGNYSYDPKTGETQQVAYKGIYFSPDGRYYLSRDPEGLETNLYITATNEDITSRACQKITKMPFGWVPGRPHHLLATLIEYDIKRDAGAKPGKARAYLASECPVKKETFLLYDVEKDSIVKEWTEGK